MHHNMNDNKTVRLISIELVYNYISGAAERACASRRQRVSQTTVIERACVLCGGRVQGKSVVLLAAWIEDRSVKGVVSTGIVLCWRFGAVAYGL